MHKNLLLSISLVGLTLIYSCNTAKSGSEPSQKLTELNEKYTLSPKLSEIRGYKNGELYEELKQRYANNLLQLNKETSKIEAKLVVVMLTPGETTTASSDFIKQQCLDNGIDFYDITKELKPYTAKQLTQTPFDSHWSKNGAEIVSNLLIPVINKYSSSKSTVKYADSERPSTFGDLDANLNEVLDGGKDLPYNLITNKQGLRMEHDLTFPKTKQTILFLGDSQIYSPFLDNKDITSNILQKKFPAKEILNAGVISYTIDDYLGLLVERAKYAEPDLIFVFTNTNDITDMFFTQRNRGGRNREGVDPSNIEEDFYKTVMLKNKDL